MQIDFYVLDNANRSTAKQFACQLIEEAYKEVQSTFLYTDSLAEAQAFNQLLWTFRDISFIPHQLHASPSHDRLIIEIGHTTQSPHDACELLVNFSSVVPDFYHQCSRIIEIVFQDVAMQQLARKRYQRYRDEGHTINTIRRG